MEPARNHITRSEMLKLSLLGSAALFIPLERAARSQLTVDDRLPEGGLPEPFTVPFRVPPILQPVGRDNVGGTDPATGRRFTGTDYYEITMQSNRLDVIGPDPSTGQPRMTEVWGYNGMLPGPTIHVRRDRRTVVRQINALPARHPELGYESTTSVHLHGSASRPQYDGYASDTSSTGRFKDYRYPNSQPARTLWYHDHGAHHTAENVYMGLVGQYHLHDDLELGLPIPHGRYNRKGRFVPSPYDVPLIVQDAIFAGDGRLIFDSGESRGGHDSLMGDVLLVNGRPWPVMEVERRKYRFRMLNASISRSYGLALSTGEELTVIGHDGGLAPEPADVEGFRIGMAERYEVVIDFSRYREGQQVFLLNQSPDNNVDFPSTQRIMRFDVVGDPASTANNEVPSELNPENEIMALSEEVATPATRAQPRELEVVRSGGMWTINGRTWDDVIASGFKETVANPELGSVEVWDLVNNSNGWFHPLHIHLVDFKIVSRNGEPPHPFEAGPKDVAYIGEGERVRIVARFGPHKGRFMVHCHNLVHEDHDMMVQYKVGTDVDDDDDPDDPIRADRPEELPAPPLFERRRRRRRRGRTRRRRGRG